MECVQGVRKDHRNCCVSLVEIKRTTATINAKRAQRLGGEKKKRWYFDWEEYDQLNQECYQMRK
jgi:hypothetical protein